MQILRKKNRKLFQTVYAQFGFGSDSAAHIHDSNGLIPNMIDDGDSLASHRTLEIRPRLTCARQQSGHAIDTFPYKYVISSMHQVCI